LKLLEYFLQSNRINIKKCTGGDASNQGAVGVVYEPDWLAPGGGREQEKGGEGGEGRGGEGQAEGVFREGIRK